MRLAFILGLIFVVAGVSGARCGSDDGAETPGGDVTLVDAPIDELEIIVRESAPPQYAARVVSGLPNGCAQFVDVELLGRAGNRITYRVQNSMPSDPQTVCTAIYGTHEETLELGSDFTPGSEYVVQVNDKEVSFTAQ